MLIIIVSIALTCSQLSVEKAKAQTPIYIRADGEVDPPTAKVTRTNDFAYTFTGLVTDPIVVQRDNIVLDGAGYALIGGNSERGIDLSDKNNVTVMNLSIGGFVYGLYLANSTSVSVSDAGISNCSGYGINALKCSNCTIRRNNVTSGLFLFAFANGSIVDNSFSVNTVRLVNLSNFNDITHNSITGADPFGMYLENSSHCTILQNTISRNTRGLFLAINSSFNTIIGNYFPYNGGFGLQIRESMSNVVTNNDFEGNGNAVLTLLASDNSFHHNNLIGNLIQAYDYNSLDKWDDGYPSGGNYWNDFVAKDGFSGPAQDASGSDGIVDKPYRIDVNNIDNYPLTGMFQQFTVHKPSQPPSEQREISVVSNSTISEFGLKVWLSAPTPNLEPGQPFIELSATGSDGSSGFCRLTIPRDIMDRPYLVLVDGNEVSATEIQTSNATHAFLYFTYSHSTRDIIVVREFTPFILLLTMVAAGLMTITVLRKRRDPDLKQ